MEYHRFNSYSSLDSIQSNREEILCYACSGVGPPLFHSTVCEKYPSSLETTPRTCLERRRHIGYYRFVNFLNPLSRFATAKSLISTVREHSCGFPEILHHKLLILHQKAL